MKYVLGLDLGVGSIGWSLIKKSDDGKQIDIVKMGSRIVPLTTDEESGFTKGNGISKNAERTQKRTARKCLDRYQQRRQYLTDALRSLNMLPTEDLIKLPPLALWQLRGDAATEGKQLSLQQIGRVLYHINQKRGYKHSRLDNSDDKKQTDYVMAVNNRFALIKEKNQTIGQYFAQKLKESEYTSEKGLNHYSYRIKEQVFPRAAYESEFDQIASCQKVFYPDIMTDENIANLRNIIFYQRPLKSCKHLVSLCEIESRKIMKDGKEITIGPKCAPKSSPLVQICNLWETVNNITVTNRKNDVLYISPEKRKEIFEFLNTHEILKLKDFQKIMCINSKDGWWAGKLIGKGLKGNTTLNRIVKALSNLSKEEIKAQTQFNIQINEEVDQETGLITLMVDPIIEEEPLFKLWRKIYSIKNEAELAGALRKYGITDEETIQKLCALDFVKEGYANKSVKAIRRILPYLMTGSKYSEACEQAGFRHSGYITKEENLNRQLKSRLTAIKKNELRQPVVEKILNQMINIVNSLIDYIGAPIDEIRVELARELKQSKDERSDTFKQNGKNEKANAEIAKKIEEYGLTPTRNRIQKYKMWEENQHFCMYCNNPVNVNEFLAGADYEVEHIIPRGLLFDNSFANKTCACRACNAKKGMTTAYDFMRSPQAPDTLEHYVDRVNKLADEKKISWTKRNRLLASHEDYLDRKMKHLETDDDKNLWENFIDRQLRQSQYIATKAVEILQEVCRNVYTTSGSVTDFVRHNWGYDEILHNLNLPIYRKVDKTEIETTVNNGVETQKERIKDWTKRLDNRHHAIDALAIACTSQGTIQRLNSLYASREAMFADIPEQDSQWKDRKSLLEKWIQIQPHPTYAETENAVKDILISVKQGKRVKVPGKRYIMKGGKRVLAQSGILVPRASLHAESVFGQIMQTTAHGLEQCYIKKYKLGIGSQGFVFTGNETYSEKTIVDKKTGIGSLKIVDKIKDTLDAIVDGHIRACILERLNRGFEEGKDYRSDVKKALDNLRNLDEDPIYSDAAHTMKIRTIKMVNVSSTMKPLHYNKNSKPISFVEPGSNHHIALYKNENNEYLEKVVTFWDAFQRAMNRLPIIIDNPAQIWDELVNRDNVPQEIMKDIPSSEWKFIMSLQINDAFIMGLSDSEFETAMEEHDIPTLSSHLYFVQNISLGNYRFRRHVESKFDTTDMNKEDKRFLNIASLSALESLNPHKVRINLLGEIIE